MMSRQLALQEVPLKYSIWNMESAQKNPKTQLTQNLSKNNPLVVTANQN